MLTKAQNRQALVLAMLRHLTGTRADEAPAPDGAEPHKARLAAGAAALATRLADGGHLTVKAAEKMLHTSLKGAGCSTDQLDHLPGLMHAVINSRSRVGKLVDESGQLDTVAFSGRLLAYLNTAEQQRRGGETRRQRAQLAAHHDYEQLRTALGLSLATLRRGGEVPTETVLAGLAAVPGLGLVVPRHVFFPGRPGGVDNTRLALTQLFGGGSAGGCHRLPATLRWTDVLEKLANNTPAPSPVPTAPAPATSQSTASLPPKAAAKAAAKSLKRKRKRRRSSGGGGGGGSSSDSDEPAKRVRRASFSRAALEALDPSFTQALHSTVSAAKQPEDDGSGRCKLPASAPALASYFTLLEFMIGSLSAYPGAV